MITEIVKGQVYAYNGVTVTIKEVVGDKITYLTHSGVEITVNTSYLKTALPNAGYTLRTQTIKPLDQAMQKLDKEYCTHKNKSEEKYFSSMVYVTCKDCGKPLN